MTLIKQEDAIEAIKKEIQDFEANYMHGEDDEEYGHDIGFVAGLHRAKHFIRSLPSSEDDWIPCSERLPSEKDGRVLVTKRDEIMIAIYSEFSGRWYLGDMCAVGGENPIAWMPLPMPYREDGE